MPLVCCLVLLLKTARPVRRGRGAVVVRRELPRHRALHRRRGTGELPLLGGNTGETTPYGFHDWEYLMTEAGKLGREHMHLARASQMLA